MLCPPIQTVREGLTLNQINSLVLATRRGPKFVLERQTHDEVAAHFAREISPKISTVSYNRLPRQGQPETKAVTVPPGGKRLEQRALQLWRYSLPRIANVQKHAIA